MHGFAYLAPASQADVINLLAEHGQGARLLAGGTGLVVGLRTGKIAPRFVVDLKRVEELAPSIEPTAGTFAISATTTMSRLLRDQGIRDHFPALVEAASTVGSAQIRNRATLAGNVCNASPAADTAPALLVYRATVVIAGPSGVRRLPLEEFLLGPRRTALGTAELVSAIELPIPEPGAHAAFGRLTRRRGVDLATISVCCSIEQQTLIVARSAARSSPAASRGSPSGRSPPSRSWWRTRAACWRIRRPTLPRRMAS